MLKVTKTGDLLPSKSNDFNIVQTFKPRTNHLPLLGPNLFFAKNVESKLTKPKLRKKCATGQVERLLRFAELRQNHFDFPQTKEVKLDIIRNVGD